MTEGVGIEKKYKSWIIGVSIAVPLAVALLFSVRIDGYDTSFLPPIYAAMNALTAVFLILGVVAIKKRRRELHQRLMTSAIVFSALFLVLYVIYHATSDSTPFGGEGWIRPVYKEEKVGVLGRSIFVNGHVCSLDVVETIIKQGYGLLTFNEGFIFLSNVCYKSEIFHFTCRHAVRDFLVEKIVHT